MADKKRIKGLTVEADGDISGLKKFFADINREVNQSSKALKNINKALKLDPKSLELLTSKQNLLAKSIEDTKKKLERLKAEQQKLDSQNVNKLSKEYTSIQLEIAKCNNELKLMNAQVNTLPASAQRFASQMDDISQKAKKLSDSTKALSKASGTVLFGSIFSASSIESDTAKIKKVIKDLSDETTQELKEIAINTRTSFSNIAEYATIGGTLGILEKDIDTFSETMRNLEVATDGAIAGEEGAKSVARFLNVMKIGVDEASNFGSSITFVGDQFAATGDEILEVASRMSGLNVLGNITAHDLIGLAAEMKNLGLRTESSASAITRMFLEIENQVATGGKNLETFAKTSGMTAEEFTNAWKSGPVEAFLNFADGIKGEVFLEMQQAVKNGGKTLEDFALTAGMSAEQFSTAWKENSQEAFNAYISGLGNLEDEATSASVILDEVGFSGVRTAEAALKLAGNGDIVRKAIEDSNKAWSENTALTEKANKVYETTEGTLKGTWEAIKQAGAEVGDVFLPMIQDGAEAVTDFMRTFKEAPKEVKQLTGGLLVFGTTISPLAKLTEKTTKGVSKLFKVFGKSKNLKETNSGLSKMLGLFMALPTPLKVVAGGVGLGAVAVGVGKLAFQLGLQNDELYQTNLKLKEYGDNLEKAKDSANEQYVNELYGLSLADLRMKQLKETIELQKQNVVSTEDVQKAVDNLNTAIGENAYSYDSSSGVLYDEKGAVDDLVLSYQNLRDVKRQSAWIDANMSAYEEAQKVIKDSETTLFDGLKSWQEYYDGLNQGLKDFIEKSGGIQQALQNIGTVPPEYQEDYLVQLKTIYNEWDKVNKIAQTAQENKKNAEDFISVFDRIASAETPSQANDLINFLSQGVDTTKIVNDLDIINQKIKDTETNIGNWQLAQKLGFGDYTKELADAQLILDNLYAEKELIEQATQQTKEQLAQTSQEQLAQSKALTEEELNQIPLAMKTAMDETMTTINGVLQEQLPSSVTTPIQDSITEGTNKWDTWSPITKVATVQVQYQVVGGVPAGVDGGAVPYSLNPINDGIALADTFSTPQEAVQRAFFNASQSLSNQLQRNMDSVDRTLSRNEHRLDSEEALVKALENMTIEVVVNNDIDGRELASVISVIQGMQVKKQR